MKQFFRRYGLYLLCIIIGAVLAAGVTAFAVGEILSAQYNYELKVIYNGEELKLDVPMIAVVDSDNPRNAVNYMPIRNVLEAMGYEVGYDSVNRAAIVNTPGTTTEEAEPDVPDNVDILSHLIVLDGTENTRDLGGYPTRDGKVTKKNVFIRSDHLIDLTEDDHRILFEEHGVDYIIDLRSARDIESSPNALPESMQDRYIALSLSPTRSPASLEDLYQDYLDNSTENIKKVFEVMASPDYNTVLFHCSQGKDRTGLLSMILLHLAGVDDSIILQDYAISADLLVEHIAKLKEESPASFEGDRERLLMTPPEAMQFAIDYLCETYGSIPEYLTAIGVTETVQNALTAKLVG